MKNEQTQKSGKMVDFGEYGCYSLTNRLYTCAISEGGERKAIWICLPRAISARLPCNEVQIICNRCPGLLGDERWLWAPHPTCQSWQSCQSGPSCQPCQP